MSTAPNVTIIPAKIQTAENRDKYHQLKVAAYCRVSTEQEEQQNSYQGTDRLLHRFDQPKKGMDACRSFCRRRDQRNSDKEKDRV